MVRCRFFLISLVLFVLSSLALANKIKSLTNQTPKTHTYTYSSNTSNGYSHTTVTTSGPEANCYASGCYNSICSPVQIFSSPCVYKPEYDCLKYTECVNDPENGCQWAQTEEYKKCMANVQKNN